MPSRKSGPSDLKPHSRLHLDYLPYYRSDVRRLRSMEIAQGLAGSILSDVLEFRRVKWFAS